MRRTLDARHFHDEEPDLEEGAAGRLGRATRRVADGFAGLIAIAAAGTVIANIFFLQGPPLRTAASGATTVSVEPKARPAAANAVPGSAPMIFGPPAASQAAVPPKAPPPAAAPPAPPPAAAPPAADGLAAMIPPASLPAPKTPSPVVADIQRELARRGFYDGAVDGLSGPRTEAGVRAFEQAARLKVTTGEPTEAVLAELRRAPAVQVAAAPAPPVVAATSAARPPAPASAPSAAPPLSPAAAAARAMLPPAAVPGDAAITGSVRPPGDVQAGSSRILAVQKALARLGYGPIKLDGQPGTETRLAVQRFERDRNLPVTGDITDRMVRELSAVSGTSIE